MPDHNFGDSGMDFDGACLNVTDGVSVGDESKRVWSFVNGDVSVGGEGELEDSAKDVRKSPKLLGCEWENRVCIALDGDVVALSRHCPQIIRSIKQTNPMFYVPSQRECEWR